MLYNADPIAKACMPTYYDTVINSYEYGSTFKDPLRVLYNTIYNLALIYRTAYLINDLLQ